ncbi:hypothetical protein LTR91_020321 [Friedmanniomyces endolithicus]|uniref:Uncharacterized protein n=1 Tax=Friedmanniomyces endolithicus TaxID=329885 RepID=A0AAN6K170_9PEZI|nr:hypothetical protein LTR57_023806 [Friedmanniomyces endolithicus]KAK0954663.1 hypothetical protein LTS01_023801 [Friedmanniomyces endolithicus]KAK0960474.1 hypothetical protein LTR91_020321 [Friedmanniomyces endolithicus]KAK1023281.1 hypothetical protein LTS16_025021 [Friedmanniomyces endolithicus]KAK1070377.1 hypothetical protein LTR33_010670 [Friedmanniomyces endolithicus]
MAYDRGTWAGRFREMSLDEKFIQTGPDTWITKDMARRLREAVIGARDGTLMTMRFARSKPFQVMEFPPEIRRHIWSHMIEETFLNVYMRGVHGAPTGMILPNIVYADKTLRAEYLREAIEKTTFSIHSGPGNQHFQKWLASTDLSDVSSYKNGFGAVKTLHFPYFSRHPWYILPADAPNNDIELMLRCPNLESVSMFWAGATLTDQNNVGKSVEQLRTEYRLDRLMQLRGLKRMVMYRFQFGNATEEVLETLVEWLREALPMSEAGERPEVKII